MKVVIYCKVEGIESVTKGDLAPQSVVYKPCNCVGKCVLNKLKFKGETVLFTKNKGITITLKQQ